MACFGALFQKCSQQYYALYICKVLLSVHIQAYTRWFCMKSYHNYVEFGPLS